MAKIRIVTLENETFVVEPVAINGLFRTSYLGAVGWGRTESGSTQDLLGAPPFEGGITEILYGDGPTKAELIAKIQEQESIEADWRRRVPTVWEINEHAKSNPPENLSLWDFRISEETPITRIIGTLTTATVRWRIVGAETYQMSAARSGFWRPARLDGRAARWPTQNSVNNASKE